MRSVKGQLATVAVAVAIAATMFALRGLPPTMNAFMAIMKGRVEEVKRYVAWDSRQETMSPAGLGLLSTAALCDSREMAEYLIERGAEVMTRDREGRTPLHWAAAGGSEDVAGLLIERGATVDVAPTPLGAGRPLQWAASNGEPEMVWFLVAHGADVRAKDEKGWTALHSAATYAGDNLNGDYGQKTIEALIELGADVNARSKEGQTPLGVAIERGCQPLARTLREHGGKE